MTKEETISKLYGLRAGLSLVVDYDDKAQEHYDEIQVLEEGIEYWEDTFSGTSSSLKKAEENLAKASLPYEETESGKDLLEERRRMRKGLIPFYGLGVVYRDYFDGDDAKSFKNSGIAFLIAAVFGLVSCVATPDPMAAVGSGIGTTILGWLLVGLWLLPRVLQLGEWCKAEIDYKKDKKYYLKNQQKKIKEAEIAIESCKKDCSNDEEILKDIMEENPVLIEEEMAKINDIEQKAADVLVELTTTYEPFLLREDWQNIDLLIFYLQTGRADTLKEALVLADRQRQTDAIVNEISKATKSIASAIKASTQTVVTGIKNATSTINTNLTTLIEMTEMQNALARHANKKIEELIEEIEDIERPSVVDVRVRN